MGFAGLCCALLGGFAKFCWLLLAFAGLCWALLGPAGLCWALLGFAGLCWALLSFAGLCWSVLAFAGLCWVLLGLAEPCWLLLGFALSWGRLRKASKSRAVHVFVDRCAFRSPARSGSMALGLICTLDFLNFFDLYPPLDLMALLGHAWLLLGCS